MLSVDDLRFNDSEIAILVSNASSRLDPDLVADICREYEGWPALVQLAVFDRAALKAADPGELPQIVRDYLQSEVVAPHSELAPVPEGYIHIGFPHPELCDAFIEIDDSVQILRSLREEQPPARPLRLRQAFRYLNPLRLFLQTALGLSGGRFSSAPGSASV